MDAPAGACGISHKQNIDNLAVPTEKAARMYRFPYWKRARCGTMHKKHDDFLCEASIDSSSFDHFLWKGQKIF